MLRKGSKCQEKDYSAIAVGGKRIRLCQHKKSGETDEEEKCQRKIIA